MNFLTYTNRVEQFEIKYPMNWQAYEGQEDTIVLFLSPLESEEDSFQENLSIAIEPAGSIIRVEYFVVEQLINLRVGFKDFQLTHEQAGRLTGRPAYQIVFSGKNKGLDIKIQQVYILDLTTRTIFLLTFTAEKEKYSTYENLSTKIIKTFKILSE